MKKKTHGKDLVFLGLTLILVLVMLYSGLRILESTVFHTGQEGSGNYVSKTIDFNLIIAKIFNNIKHILEVTFNKNH